MFTTAHTNTCICMKKHIFFILISVKILAGRLFRFSSVDHCMSEKIWIDNQIVHLNFSGRELQPAARRLLHKWAKTRFKFCLLKISILKDMHESHEHFKLKRCLYCIDEKVYTSVGESKSKFIFQWSADLNQHLWRHSNLLA